MQEHAQQIITATSTATYGLSFGLMFGEWLQFLNTSAAAIGVILGFLTFLVNCFFQAMNHRLIKANNGERRNDG